MGTVSTTLPSDGQTIDASDVNTPINAILSEFNGNIDDNNIKTGANINGAKIGAATLPGSAFDATIAGGWLTGALPAVSSVTYNGNRSYDIAFASTVASILSSGMRLRTTRTVAAPTQCTDLESGSSQYYSKSSPNKLTFTDDFVVSAWVKLESYALMSVASRYNGTSGWDLTITAAGQVQFYGFNGGAGNQSGVLSYQSIPLNKWVHIAAQLDMSAFTATTTTSFVMIDGVDVPASVARAGTNPTALIQAGNLEIGGRNGGLQPFDGKIAQVAIYNAKVTQATIKASINQGLSGSETSLASAYSFNNAITDLNTTTPNDLTANGSAVATNADSPFGNGAVSSTLDYALVQSISTTVATVQVPEGCTIPTSGGVSSAAYSVQGNPYGWVSDKGRWYIETLLRANKTIAFSAINTWAGSGITLSVPVGQMTVGARAPFDLNSTVSGARSGTLALSNSTYAPTTNGAYNSLIGVYVYTPSATDFVGFISSEYQFNITSVAVFELTAQIPSATGTETYILYSASGPTGRIYAVPSNL